MEIEETSGPYRGFVRSGSYPAATRRIVDSGTVLLRAASWFALIVIAASAGYNMTQRLVSQTATSVNPQRIAAASTVPGLALATSAATPVPARKLEPAVVEPQGAPQQDVKEVKSVDTSSQALPLRTVSVAVPTKRTQTGAIVAAARPQHRSTTRTDESDESDDDADETSEPTDVAASASQPSQPSQPSIEHAERIAERVRALDDATSETESERELTVKEPVSPTVTETPAATSGNFFAFSGRRAPTPPRPVRVHQPLPAPEPVAQQQPLAATTRVDLLAVNGSVSSANLRHGLARVQPNLTECYANAAQRAGENRFAPVRVQVQIDEAGRVKTPPTISGAQLPGLEACVSSAFSKLVCRAPDTGTAKASLAVRFGPLQAKR